MLSELGFLGFYGGFLGFGVVGEGCCGDGGGLLVWVVRAPWPPRCPHPSPLPPSGFFAQPYRRRILGQIMCVARCTAPLDSGFRRNDGGYAKNPKRERGRLLWVRGTSASASATLTM